MEEDGNSKRRSLRSNVMLVARLILPDRAQDVRLRNLSEGGALVEGAGPVEQGCPITFCRKELQVPGRIVWVEGELAGIAFSQPLDRRVVLRHIPQRQSRPPPPAHWRPAVLRHQSSAEERSRADGWGKRKD